MTPLPIFRLPRLVYIKIINQMSLTEQIFTALCSRRVYALVKDYRSKAINLSLCIKPHSMYFFHRQRQSSMLLQLSIGLESTWNTEKVKKSIDIQENRGLRYTMDSRNGHDILEICWKDRTVGLMNMLELASDLFRIVLYGTVEIRGPQDMWIFYWFKEQQKTPEVLVLRNQIPDDDIKHVFLNNTAQRLWIHAEPTASLKIQSFPNVFGDLSISSRFRITIDNLIELDCIELQIYNEHFTNQDVNRFLKHWIKGGSSRLKYLRIGIQEHNQNEVFKNIRNHVTHVPGDREYTSPYNSHFTFNGFQIQRKDGVTASIQYFNGIFLLGVWPDANGNT